LQTGQLCQSFGNRFKALDSVLDQFTIYLRCCR